MPCHALPCRQTRGSCWLLAVARSRIVGAGHHALPELLKGKAMKECKRPVACLIDGRFFETKARAHEILISALHFPDYYGKNLDALHDCLTDMKCAQVCVYFAADARRMLGAYADALFQVMLDSAKENAGLTVRISE